MKADFEKWAKKNTVGAWWFEPYVYAINKFAEYYAKLVTKNLRTELKLYKAEVKVLEAEKEMDDIIRCCICGKPIRRDETAGHDGINKFYCHEHIGKMYNQKNIEYDGDYNSNT